MTNDRHRFLTEQSGQAVVLSAIFLAVIAIGFLAVAVDAGMLFRQKRMAQAAADAASQAAAEEIALGYSSDEQSVANQVAKLNGFDTTLASHPATVVLSTPSTGSFTGSNYVEATVSKPIHNLFLGAFNSKLAYLTVSAQAIAGGASTSPTCVCLTGGSSSDLVMSNGASISAPSCGVVDNSTSSQAITMAGGATISALTLGTISSTWNTGSNIYGGSSISSSTKVVQGISHGCSATLPAVPSYSNCQGDPGGGGGTYTVGPAVAGGTVCYTSLTVGANNSKVTLTPGIYVITNGSVHFESGNSGYSNLGGEGVFFYILSGGSLLVDNGANVNLVAGGNKDSLGVTATSTGAYDGILVYQPASNTNAVTVAGGATAYMNGSILAPGAAVNLSNGSGSTIAGSIASQTLNMSGGGTLTAVSGGNEGSLVMTSPKLVQ